MNATLQIEIESRKMAEASIHFPSNRNATSAEATVWGVETGALFDAPKFGASTIQRRADESTDETLEALRSASAWLPWPWVNAGRLPRFLALEVV